MHTHHDSKTTQRGDRVCGWLYYIWSKRTGCSALHSSRGPAMPWHSHHHNVFYKLLWVNTVLTLLPWLLYVWLLRNLQSMRPHVDDITLISEWVWHTWHLVDQLFLLPWQVKSSRLNNVALTLSWEQNIVDYYLSKLITYIFGYLNSSASLKQFALRPLPQRRQRTFRSSIYNCTEL